MKHINFITFNLGTVKRETSKNMTKQSWATMQKIVRQAKMNELADVVDGTVLELVLEDDGNTYMATLYNNRNDLIPLLTTAGSVIPEKVQEIWDDYKELSEKMPAMPLIKKDPSSGKLDKFDCSDLCPASAPVVCDILYMGMLLHPEISMWTGAFVYCLAWTILGNKVAKMKE